MAFLRRWFLISLVLALGCGLSSAAGSRKENRDYAAAVGAFNDAMWSRAETEFAQFTEKYPASTHVPEAVLLRAQAELKQGKLAEAVALLKSSQAAAGTQADEYVYWTGAAQLQGRDYSTAAKTFISLPQNFPNSRLRLRAVVEAAGAFTELRQWPQVIGLLQETNGVFQDAVLADTGSELAARGQLLLAQAKFAQGDFAGASSVLSSMTTRALPPELDWQRVYLLCQTRLAAGEMDAALAATTNLLQIGSLEKGGALRAESMALRAVVLEKMGRLDDAAAAYHENLVTNVPAIRQREAALKIAELAVAQKQFSNAVPVLEKFFAEFPGSPAADTVLLTLGELQLKDYVAQPAATNQLSAAQARFEQFIGTFTNSPLLGLAHLNRGWCRWLAEKRPESLDDFKAAAQTLPPSEERAVAHFKMGDVLFAQKDFAGALVNYQAALDGGKAFPAASRTLGDRALYQILRASLELKNVAGATNALAQILEFYPASELAPGGALLVGESQTDLTQPAAARALFENFEATFPGSPLRPQVDLAVARTYEQQQDWPAAIGKYEGWLKNNPTNALQWQVNYAQAQANFQAGNETNALRQFTNFVAQFPANELAPLAQWWVADYFFRQPDFVNAERNYKFVFENWPASGLAYPARMMAGRAAVARLGYSEAIRDYFTKLEQDTNCPIDLRVQATFAHGTALMLWDSADTNQPLANFQKATDLFAQICRLYPTNELGALAWGEIGNCALQLSAFDAATNAYAQVFNSPFAGVSARSQAQVGCGIALEKMAARAAGAERTALLKLALDNYLAVFDSRFEANDPFWVKKAGLQALPLAAQIGAADDLNKFMDHLEKLFPQSMDSLEKKRAALLVDKK